MSSDEAWVAAWRQSAVLVPRLNYGFIVNALDLTLGVGKINLLFSLCGLILTSNSELSNNGHVRFK